MKRSPLARKTPLKQGNSLKRTGRIRHKPRRRPQVDWDALRAIVLERDVRAITVHVKHRFGLETLDGALSNGRLVFYTPFGPMQWCVAPMVDRAEEGQCEGALEWMHVQDPSDPMFGRKVPDEPGFLAIGCAWHHQGSKAGRVWATASENLELLSNYLKETSNGGQGQGRGPDQGSDARGR